MRLDDGGDVVVTLAELDLLARLAAYGLRRVEQEDGGRVPGAQRLLYDARLYAGQLGSASVVASVTSIGDAPSRRVWVDCGGCGRSTDRPRRGLCDACRKREDRARGQAGDSDTLSA